MVAWEHGRLLTEQLGGGHRRAPGEGAQRLLAHGDDDARGRRAQRVDVGAIAADRPGPVGEQRVVAGAVILGRHPEEGGIRRGLREVLVGELASPRRHGDEGRHAGTRPLGLVRVANAGAGALGRRGVGEHRDERRLVRHQGAHVVGMGRHERERGHRAPTAREHLDRAGAERLDDGVHVVRLDRGRMVDPAVLADAAAEAARVIPDHGAVGEVRRQRGEATGVHGLTDHEQRWASVGGGQRPVDVIGDVGLGGLKHVCRRHDGVDRSRIENSSALGTKGRRDRRARGRPLSPLAIGPRHPRADARTRTGDPFITRLPRRL